ncbi:MAG TPA: hypothetical protein VF868_00480, partial [Bacteroidia bacterium]
MKKLLLFLIGAFLHSSIYSQAQLTPFQDWATKAGTQNFFYKNVTKTDGSGNVYVAGATLNGAGNYDVLLAKFNSSGVQQWIVQIDGSAGYQDFATALQLDGSGNVYITGAITNDTTSMMSDLFFKKYNSSGVLQWTNTYDGFNLYDCGTDILVNTGGTMAVVGSSFNTSGNLDFVTIFYNSSGVQQWANRYAHSSGFDDVPVRIVKSGTGVAVAGAVKTGASAYNWAALVYRSNGVLNSTTISSGGTSGIEEVRDMVTDANGNIYLAGFTPSVSNGYDYDVIKMDSNLVIQWERTYDENGFNDKATALKVNSTGDVYVTGYSHDTTEQNNYLTLKYNSSGSLIWARTFNDSLNGDDEAYAMAMDSYGKIYITGNAKTALSQMDYHTIKYDTAGTVEWSIDFDGAKHLDDRATNIAIDSVGAVVVTGASETAANVYEYATVKYIENNIIIPTDFGGEPLGSNYLYYQNKGQVLGSNDTIVPYIKFYTEGTYPDYYFKDNGFCIAYSKIDTSYSNPDTLNRVDVSFFQSAGNARTFPLDQHKSFINYYVSHIPDGITKVHGNERLVTPGLYKNIDLEYSSNADGLKYYFIIKPGGTPSAIKPEFTGASSFNLNGTTNVLTVNSNLGSVAFDRPIVYQLSTSNAIIPITGWTANWQNNGATNKYKFNIGAYDSTKVLIIEVKTVVPSVSPTAVTPPEWNTFLGGTKDDHALDIASDDQGNIYVAGYTSSPQSGTNPFPISNGPQQAILKGTKDAFIAKFDVNYAREFVTYYGGNGDERANGVDHTNANGGQLFVCGTTTVSDTLTLLPWSAGSGSYVNSTAFGGDQGFIARFNASSGFRNWHTYWGGYNTVIHKVRCDTLGNAFIVGMTGNSSNANSCAPSGGSFNRCNPGGGAYTQIWHGGGTFLYDGFIAKFNPSTSLV